MEIFVVCRLRLKLASDKMVIRERDTESQKKTSSYCNSEVALVRIFVQKFSMHEC